MGRKGGKYKKKENIRPFKENATGFDSGDDDMMNDEIDAFHKQRDILSLNVNEELEESDEDNEQPVFDFEDDKDEDVDDEDYNSDDDEDDQKDDYVDDEDGNQPKGLAAKIARTQKYLRSKFGGVEDEIIGDQEKDDSPRIWKKLHGADVDNEVLSSDEQDAEDEEAEVLRLQSEKSKALTFEDYGLDIAGTTGREATLEEVGGKFMAKPSLDEQLKDDHNIAYETVKKDLNSLTKEEQMSVVYSSAPELVGLLSELKDALEQLENKVKPLLKKIKGQDSAMKGGVHYIEVKQLILQSFCQAITFYLLLKSEGHSVRDHPVISRLVEIKGLLDKMKEMDDNLPFDVEDSLMRDLNDSSALKFGEETAALKSDSLAHGQNVSLYSEEHPAIEDDKTADLNILKITKTNISESKSQDKCVRPQSAEMLKARAALVEKLKQKGVFSSIAPKNVRAGDKPLPMNRQFQTLDDFDDEVMEIDRVSQGRSNGQLSHHSKKRKVISGDDDIPKRDDIGERRWKHQLRVLAGAGIKSVDDIEDNAVDEIGNVSNDAADIVDWESDSDSASDYYEQAKQQHAVKVAAKANQYSRIPEISSLPETAVDGKRLITIQMEKNRGLTRRRNKKAKNARKKYRNKHTSAEIRRKGQVREIRKPTGPYGGEASGVNTRISRSVRFKN